MGVGVGVIYFYIEAELNYPLKLKCYNFASILTFVDFQLFRLWPKDISFGKQEVQSFMSVYIYVNSCVRSSKELQSSMCKMTINTLINKAQCLT